MQYDHVEMKCLYCVYRYIYVYFIVYTYLW